MSEAEAPPPPKADPETLVLRASPPRAVRFRRGVIITAGALGAAALAAVTWTALSPVALQHAAPSEDMSQPNSLPASDTLNRLPSTYGDVPRLGPPLPGDLGRPILDHQRAVEEQSSGLPAGQGTDERAADKRMREAAALQSARQSAILFREEQPAAAPPGFEPKPAPLAPASIDAAGAVPGGYKPSLDPVRDPNAQEHKTAFVATSDDRDDRNPHSLTPAPSPYLLSAGSVIPASLITGLRSDLPGLVIAQVTERVYDSPTGHTLLIPQGARLIGAYDSVVAFGQRRALIVWQRIVMPDGSALKLDNAPASDAAGYAGLEDEVDFHTWTLLKGVALSTLLGVGSELALSGDSDLVRAIRLSTQNSSARAGDQITSRNLAIQPTITIRPGARVRLVLHRDLLLEPWNE